ncbi:sulfurtransferase [Ectobacillus ponti]|uniref:Sulfurtransferase n=1 Tax=Ectobacillus ponti TaxID=2961894 RepID=A0AA42BQU1_9BACI|nr:sulfurtransferase [Ectobacillus ponti]MCP8968814.1 sulfurtransferase [Ectobacillus ponti]
MKHIVEAGWLAERLQDSNIRIIDCRFDLGRPAWGRGAYIEGHIPGALYFDLNEDLSAPVGEHGGRHPLPDWHIFAEKLSAAGIDDGTIVVAYDSQAGAMASRLWWMLTYLGHSQVYVLNGGLQAWGDMGYPVTADVPQVERKTFLPREQTHLLLSMEHVRERIQNGGEYVLLDAREPHRYAGIEEPIDRKAGHIPTAVSAFWKDGVAEDGRFKAGEEQRQRFAGLHQEKEIIVYCGSGVTACPNVLALQEAGFQNVKLYAGSFSDWISYEANAVIKS